MARTDLPPPPLGNDVSDYPWQEWFRLLLRRVAEEGQISVGQISGLIPWDKVNKNGSDLNDLATKQHSVLTQLDYDSSGHTGFARELGDNTVQFQVADADEPDEAVSKGQLDSEIGQLIRPLDSSDTTGIVSYTNTGQSIASGAYQTIFDVTGAVELLGGSINSVNAGYRLTIDGVVILDATGSAAGDTSSGNDQSSVSLPPAKGTTSMKLEAYNAAASSRGFGWRVITRQ